MPVTKPNHDGLADENKMADPNPDIVISEVTHCSTIGNNDAANRVGTRVLVRPTAYRASLDKIAHESGLGLDTFPVCERVIAKADGSNSSSLVLPIKRYLADMRTYLMQ